MTTRLPLFALPLLLAAAPVAAQTEPPPFKLVTLQAQLYYSDLGRLSPNIIDNKAFGPLFNVIIGEGGAEGKANQLLVTLVVGGQPGSLRGGQGARVELVASEGKKIVQRARAPVGIIGAGGKWFHPVLVNDVGCTTLRLEATLVDAGRTSRLARTLAFTCGE